MNSVSIWETMPQKQGFYFCMDYNNNTLNIVKVLKIRQSYGFYVDGLLPNMPARLVNMECSVPINGYVFRLIEFPGTPLKTGNFNHNPISSCPLMLKSCFFCAYRNDCSKSADKQAKQALNKRRNEYGTKSHTTSSLHRAN